MTSPSIPQQPPLFSRSSSSRPRIPLPEPSWRSPPTRWANFAAVGGIIFGRLGDGIGHKKSWSPTLMIIGVATVLIGVLPGYASIGIIAPIMLVLLALRPGRGSRRRMGRRRPAFERIRGSDRRGFWASAAQVGPPAGNLLANGALAILTLTLTEEQFISFGWRIAFLGVRSPGRLRPVDPAQARRHPHLQGDRGPRRDSPVGPGPRGVQQGTAVRWSPPSSCRVGPDVVYALFTVFTLTYGIQALGYEREPGSHGGPDRIGVPAVYDPAGRRRLGQVQPAAVYGTAADARGRVDVPVLRGPRRRQRSRC